MIAEKIAVFELCYCDEAGADKIRTHARQETIRVLSPGLRESHVELLDIF